ncbi:MAG: SDR family oxidoreductase [Rickettsiales bacterium]
MQENTKNKVALITGSGKRIGREVAYFLAEKGWKIILHYNHSKKEVQEVSNKINKITDSHLVSFDLSEPNDYESIISSVSKDFARPTLLINNASTFNKDSLENISLDKLETQIRVNCNSQIILSKAFYEHNKDNGLNIINFNDYAAEKINSSYFSYYLSKHLFLYSTKIMAEYMAPRCRVNTLSFGHVIKDEVRSDAEYDKIISQTPLKQKVKIGNVTSAIEFVINSESVTGTNIHIDSGASVKAQMKL